jgi:hypothetical protein
MSFFVYRYANHLDFVGQYTIKKGSMFGLTQSLIKLMQYYMNLIGLGTLLLLFYNLSPENQPSSKDILTVSESHRYDIYLFIGLIQRKFRKQDI